jgi:anti-sigma28 factor (negative regulator of flagellin synthesis)
VDDPNDSETAKLIGLAGAFTRPSPVRDSGTSPIESSLETGPRATSADYSIGSDATDEVRMERVGYLIKRIADGTYKVATEEIADKILDYLGSSGAPAQDATPDTKVRRA